ESGVLISEVHAVKQTPSHHFVLADAGFNDLMRPALYGSYHNITVLPADGVALSARRLVPVVVAGPLCEAGDVFTQASGGVVTSRLMRESQVGDLLVFHNV